MKERIVLEWFGGCNRRDWDAIKALYAEDAVIHGKEGILRGGDGVVTVAKKWLTAIPDGVVTPVYSTCEGEVIVVHWRMEGTLKGSIRDIAATGKKVVFHGLTCFRCRNQTVVEHWAAVDYRPLTQEVCV
ncbi:MAG: ester cyclase [Chlamydiia bacterium]|nr:ester cyclase [Chlamydiia bacterium]